jgi:hypothetical protein
MGRVRLLLRWSVLAGAVLWLNVAGQAPMRRTRTPNATEKASNKQRGDKDALPTFAGPVKDFDGKILTIDQGEGNALQFHCSRKTKYYDGDKKKDSSILQPGVVVNVTGKQAADASLDAVTVRVEKVQPGPVQ